MKAYRKIKHLQVTDTFHVPGHGALKGRTLNTTNYPGITMVMSDFGVNCALSSGLEFLIPFSRIEVAVYVSSAIEPKEEKLNNAA